MRTIRRSVFETNSSSCHSISILTEKEYNDFRENKCFFDWTRNYLVSLETVKEDIKNCLSKEQDYIKNLEEAKQENREWAISNYTKLLEEIDRLKQVSDDDIKTIWDWFIGSYDAGSGMFFQFDTDSNDNKALIEFAESKKFTKEQTYVLEYFRDNFSNTWSFETYGGDEYETDSNFRNIDGVNVHVLSYMGYN